MMGGGYRPKGLKSHAITRYTDSIMAHLQDCQLCRERVMGCITRFNKVRD